MDTPSPFIRDLAWRLLAVEASGQPAAGSRVHEAGRVFEKLRISLTRIAGADGFTALLRRSLALAREETPGLHGVTQKADGSIEGLAEITIDGNADAAVAIIANLLGLLVVFIGEPLTMRLVREAWPDASLGE